MRLKATDPEATKIRAVYVDGKRISHPVEFDTVEGWCVGLVPKLDKEAKDHAGSSVDNPIAKEVIAGFSEVQVKFEGKVQVVFAGEL